ncbi:hypothetical protein NP233_g1628 [Leucocoprinus birnbaumii]|uniref:Uncharacterized protein n=1 Tax=Leucocoprinus birnbaumii TaxID=56174 RepID=A0AAD5YZD5_9AGAR|nr:hypothetical protein NP233_g1628 [Leucocoprinus birnbaumii]
MASILLDVLPNDMFIQNLSSRLPAVGQPGRGKNAYLHWFLEALGRVPALKAPELDTARLMTIADGAQVEWTTSRITRLLRPLKSKCLALQSYTKENTSGNVATNGARRLGGDQELLPLEIPSNIGLRIHFSWDMVQTFELSRRIRAIRDCYCDLLSKDISAREGGTSVPRVSSLTSLCSVILGAQIPWEDEPSESDDGPNQTEVLYEAVPASYRLRTLMMHALHIILQNCPPNASLYLSLLDITLERGLYHESEVLLDAILDYAFEPSLGNGSRVSNPTHRRFLVDLYSDWNTRFSSGTFVRLTIDALRRASSNAAWTSKATRRLVRKLGRYDIDMLSLFLAGAFEHISMRKRATKPIDGLDAQFREWLQYFAEICLSSMEMVSESLMRLQNPEMLNDLIGRLRSSSMQMVAEGCGSDPSFYAYSDAMACLYTLWLISGPRQIGQGDTFHMQIQRYFPPSSTFVPFCNHLLRTKSLSACRDVLAALSTTLMNHDLPRLRASLWACALAQIEEPEIEAQHIERYGRESVRDFRLWLVDSVDDAEKDCFATPHIKPFSVREPDTDSGRSSGRASGWRWEASVGCWFRSGPRSQDDVPVTPKRRKIFRHSYPSPRKPLFSARLSQHSFVTKSSTAGEDAGLCFLRGNPGDLGDSASVVRAPVSFSSLLSNAVLSRSDIRISHEEPFQNIYDNSRAAAAEESEESDDGSHTDDYDITNDFSIDGDHAPSEDHLDLFRIAGTSPARVTLSLLTLLGLTPTLAMSKSKDQKVLSLQDTLRDLALLRTSDIDLAALVPSASADAIQQSEENKAIEASLQSSYDYVRSARNVMKINDRGDVDAEGRRIEVIREKLSQVEEGLASGQA